MFLVLWNFFVPVFSMLVKKFKYLFGVCGNLRLIRHSFNWLSLFQSIKYRFNVHDLFHSPELICTGFSLVASKVKRTECKSCQHFWVFSWCFNFEVSFSFHNYAVHSIGLPEKKSSEIHLNLEIQHYKFCVK